MNHDEFLESMKQKYPLTFKSLTYIECESGWFNIIDSLACTIENHLKRLDPEVADEMYVVQCKEKFGGLRWYMAGSDDFIDGAVGLAENLSVITCEDCGCPAPKLRAVRGWIKCLCDKHFEEHTNHVV